jgi:hypothetical protein
MSTSSSIAERIIQYLDIKNVTQEAFARDSQHGEAFDKGTLGKAAKPGAKIGAYAVEKFLRMFPEVSPYWLILGEGEITLNRKLLQSHENLESSYILTLKDVIKELGVTLNDLRGRVQDKEKIIMLLESRS